MPKELDPAKNRWLTVWEMTRDLAYQVFDVREKKEWSQQAQAYNTLVLGWSEIPRLAWETGGAPEEQAGLFE